MEICEHLTKGTEFVVLQNRIEMPRKVLNNNKRSESVLNLNNYSKRIMSRDDQERCYKCGKFEDHEISAKEKADQ